MVVVAGDASAVLRNVEEAAIGDIYLWSEFQLLLFMEFLVFFFIFTNEDAQPLSLLYRKTGEEVAFSACHLPRSSRCLSKQLKPRSGT